MNEHERHAERIVSLLPSATEIAFALGLGRARASSRAWSSSPTSSIQNAWRGMGQRMHISE